jgi:hypothetical protein
MEPNHGTLDGGSNLLSQSKCIVYTVSIGIHIKCHRVGAKTVEATDSPASQMALMVEPLNKVSYS